ncbi:hypothetical protein AB2066_004285 [Vibrio vulnificus]
MEVQDCYTYVQLGLAIRMLRNQSTSNSKKATYDTLATLKNGLQAGNFPVTLALMSSSSFIHMENELKNADNPDEKLDDSLVKKVRKELTAIEDVVFAESSIKKIYILPNRRFNTEYLLDSPEKLFAEGTFEKLDDIAQHDIRSSCKCLLFGEPTASAFHILRATESVLKHYYYHHRRTNRLSKPMWANMVDQLRAKTRNKPPETLLNSLDLIRTAYRNPTQHPQATYQIDSAQDLFGVCLDVIGKMGSEL